MVSSYSQEANGAVANPGMVDPDGVDNDRTTGSDNDFRLNGAAVDNGRNLGSASFASVTIQGTPYYLYFDDCLDPDNTNLKATPPVAATVKQSSYNGWERGAYVFKTVSAPVLYNPLPSGTREFTGSEILQVSSDKNCTVKRGASGVDPGDYDACTATFTSTGELIHTETISTAANTSYHYYCYAEDSVGNETGPVEIIFTTGGAQVETPAKTIQLSGGGNATMTIGAGTMTITMQIDNPVQQVMITKTVGANNDDGYYRETTHAWISAGNYNWLYGGYSGEPTAEQRSMHYRFDVDIPAGAIIDSATVTTKSGESNIDGAVFDIYAEDVNDSAEINSASAYEAAVADLTTAYKNWNLPATVAGENYEVDCKDVVQEVVTDNSGSNHLQLFCRSSASTSPYRPLAYEYGAGYAEIVIIYHMPQQ
jgi:hypothetical protein